jgi:hypothetical protein
VHKKVIDNLFIMLFAFLLSVAILSTISIIRAHAFVQPEHAALRQLRGDCRPNLISAGRLPMLKFNLFEHDLVFSSISAPSLRPEDVRSPANPRHPRHRRPASRAMLWRSAYDKYDVKPL